MNASTVSSSRLPIQPTNESLLAAAIIEIDEAIGLHQEIARLYSFLGGAHRGQSQMRQTLAWMFIPDIAIPALANRASTPLAKAAIQFLGTFSNLSTVAESLLAHFDAE